MLPAQMLWSVLTTFVVVAWRKGLMRADYQYAQRKRLTGIKSNHTVPSCGVTNVIGTRVHVEMLNVMLKLWQVCIGY